MLINVNMEEVIEDLDEKQCKELYEDILNKVGKVNELKWTQESYKFYGLEDNEVFDSIRQLISEFDEDQLEIILNDIEDLKNAEKES